MASRLSISEQVRREIKRSKKAGLSLYRIGKVSGVSYATLHRFKSGTHNLVVENLEKVIDALGLKLTLDEKTTKRRR